MGRNRLHNLRHMHSPCWWPDVSSTRFSEVAGAVRDTFRLFVRDMIMGIYVKLRRVFSCRSPCRHHNVRKVACTRLDDATRHVSRDADSSSGVGRFPAVLLCTCEPCHMRSAACTRAARAAAMAGLLCCTMTCGLTYDACATDTKRVGDGRELRDDGLRAQVRARLTGSTARPHASYIRAGLSEIRVGRWRLKSGCDRLAVNAASSYAERGPPT